MLNQLVTYGKIHNNNSINLGVAMKYFTKEWRYLCGKTGFHESLKEDMRASVYSEDYFNELYQKELNRYLELQKKLYSIPFAAELDPKAIELLESRGASQYTIEKFKRKYLIRREAMKKNHDLRYPYNEQREIENCKTAFESKLTRVKNILPEYILKDVADIRVLAQRRATNEIIERVKVYCEENKKRIDNTLRDYYEYFNEASKSFDIGIVRNMHFHDCRVTGMQHDEESLTLFIDNVCGYTDINQIIFNGYKIIKQDESLLNAWWLYDEVYKVDERYEIHVLLDRGQSLIDFIVSAELILFNHEY